MSKVEYKIFSEMKSELDARKRVLLAEKEQLLKATARIAEIDAELAVIDGDIQEYKSAIDALPAESKPAKETELQK